TLEDLKSLPADHMETLRAACRHAALLIKVTSAFAIGGAQRDSIEQGLKKLTQDNASVQFGEDSRLRAGLRISIGPWVLRANLADELEFFAHGLAQERDR
ncbi:MAG TPA: F0F1 ATP synthase subunit delta, partial [Terriglobales bacterium]|nr:F0F1 ATP synthase subunit delta [Terriglobales bacterium]